MANVSVYSSAAVTTDDDAVAVEERESSYVSSSQGAEASSTCLVDAGEYVHGGADDGSEVSYSA